MTTSFDAPTTAIDDITGNYAEFGKALGCYTERVTDPGQIAHALVNGINATKEGKPVLLEFITTRDKIRSEPRRGGGYGNEGTPAPGAPAAGAPARS